jgi:hypothetical protein
MAYVSVQQSAYAHAEYERRPDNTRSICGSNCGSTFYLPGGQLVTVADKFGLGSFDRLQRNFPPIAGKAEGHVASPVRRRRSRRNGRRRPQPPICKLVSTARAALEALAAGELEAGLCPWPW